MIATINQLVDNKYLYAPYFGYFMTYVCVAHSDITVNGLLFLESPKVTLVIALFAFARL